MPLNFVKKIPGTLLKICPKVVVKIKVSPFYWSSCSYFTATVSPLTSWVLHNLLRHPVQRSSSSASLRSCNPGGSDIPSSSNIPSYASSDTPGRWVVQIFLVLLVFFSEHVVVGTNDDVSVVQIESVSHETFHCLARAHYHNPTVRQSLKHNVTTISLWSDDIKHTALPC